MRCIPLALIAPIVMFLLLPQPSVSVNGVPILYRGEKVGCSEQFVGLVSELAEGLGSADIYVFGIKGCPECDEMEDYLKKLAGSNAMIYVDILQHKSYYENLISVLASYVDRSYISEVPVVLVVRDGTPVLIHVGIYLNNTFWIQVISGDYSGACIPSPRGQSGVTLGGALFGAVVAGLAAAFSPCVLYLYMALLLSYSTTERSLNKLLLFVAGLGSGYLIILFGLSSVLSLVRPYSWVLLTGFGAYMIAHSRGLLGCLIGGRSCRDLEYQSTLPSAAASSFPLVLGVLAAVSAIPCGAGYFILLQAAVGATSSVGALLVLVVYFASFLAPYIAASILSARLLKTLERISGKIALVELVGGLVLISLGAYFALRELFHG